LVLQRIPKVVVRLGVIGIEAERLAVAGDGFIQMSKLSERTAEVVVRLGVIGIEGERLAVTGNGIFRLPQVLCPAPL